MYEKYLVLWEAKQGLSDPLELEVQVIYGLIWVLGTQPRSPEQSVLVNNELSLYSLNFIVSVLFQ